MSSEYGRLMDSNRVRAIRIRTTSFGLYPTSGFGLPGHPT